AQASFVADLGAGRLDDHRVDQAPDLVLIALHHTYAHGHSNLVRGQPRAGRVEHGLGEVVDQLLDGRVYAWNLPRLLAQNRVLDSQDWPDHEWDFTQAVLRLRQPARIPHHQAPCQLVVTAISLDPDWAQAIEGPTLRPRPGVPADRDGETVGKLRRFTRRHR